MRVIRLTSIPLVIRHWAFIQNGIVESERFLRYELPIDTYRKMLFHLVKQPTFAWVGLVLAEDDTPLGFAIAYDCTPLFSTKRQFEASIIYHRPGNQDATGLLQSEFEDFCRFNSISSYFATTRRDSGAAIRCFQAPRYGFKRAYTTFVKEIT